MENILLVLNVILAIILVILVLFQKSEGGALGIGVSQDNFMFSRTAGDFLTKATGIVATLFIICSLSLTIISRGDLMPETSIIDKIEESEDTPKIPDKRGFDPVGVVILSTLIFNTHTWLLHEYVYKTNKFQAIELRDE